MLFSSSCNLLSVRFKDRLLIGYGPRITPRRTQKITLGTTGNLRNGAIKISRSVVLLRRVDLVRLFKMAKITKIERLDGKNYQTWKYNIKVLLMEHSLWGFVEGTETASGASAKCVQCKMRTVFVRTKLIL